MSNSKAWITFSKLIKFGSTALSVLVAIVSLCLGIYSAIATNNTGIIGLDWRIVICIIVFNSVFLIGAAIFECIIYIQGKNIIEQKDAYKAEVIEREKRLSNFKIHFDYIMSYFVNFAISLHNETDEIIINNDKFQNEIYDLKKLQARHADDERLTIELQGMIDNRADDYRESIKKAFNKFLIKCLDDLKDCIDQALSQKDLQLKSSISIKLFNKACTNKTDYSTINVITAFRDRITYNTGKRETNSRIYTILNNSAFVHCLSNEYYLHNNISKNISSYANENPDYAKHYNCTLVVPITYSHLNNKYYLGYLACDTLNPNIKSNDDVFDESMVKIVQFVAHTIGSYIDNMDYQWRGVLETLSYEYNEQDLMNENEHSVDDGIEEIDEIEELEEDIFLNMVFKMKSGSIEQENNYEK